MQRHAKHFASCWLGVGVADASHGHNLAYPELHELKSVDIGAQWAEKVCMGSGA